ncbi:MAG: Mut7-C ubiquitin/RNAse domain-containing protein, partial [Chloroflexota bacterium]|nr:Mut7-C ubiquitin/RNAse domain-containing protein [Chloroflexota bacterium]
GVPHTEVGLLLANGEPVDFSYLVKPGDRISVYPAFRSLALGEAQRLREPVGGRPAFILDTHLGRLAGYLRMLGFDTLYCQGCDDDYLAQRSASDERILLTRDRGLLKRSIVTQGYWVRATDPEQQATEVLQRFGLVGSVLPFRRCMRCNGMLEPVDKAQVLDRLEPLTRQHYDEFRTCTSCGAVYWKGSHHERMQELIRRLTQTSA